MKEFNCFNGNRNYYRSILKDLNSTLCRACPDNGIFFAVLFGLANGPLTWAVVFFRNSVVFHSTDKMTSTFIHVLPPYVLYW